MIDVPDNDVPEIVGELEKQTIKAPTRRLLKQLQGTPADRRVIDQMAVTHVVSLDDLGDAADDARLAESSCLLCPDLEEELETARRLWGDLDETLHGATQDEMAVVHAFVAQLMGEGRREYGPLDLSTDPRSLDDLLGDLANEGLDRNFYAIVAKMKREQG